MPARPCESPVRCTPAERPLAVGLRLRRNMGRGRLVRAGRSNRWRARPHHSSSTPSPDGSSAGGSRVRCRRSSSSMPSSRQSTIVVPRRRMPSCTTAIADRSTCRSDTPSGSREPGSTRRWAFAIVLEPMAHQWLTGDSSDTALAETVIVRGGARTGGALAPHLQDRGDPTPRPLAQPRGGRIRHTRVGRLVQHRSQALSNAWRSPAHPSRADRDYPARRG